MKLNAAQVKHFETEGWLFTPEAFSMQEVAALRTEAEGIYAANFRGRQQVSGRKRMLINCPVIPCITHMCTATIGKTL